MVSLAALVLAASAASPAPNVVLVTIDSLRPDHLSPYGARAETPAMERLAREGAVALDATVAAPQTAASHATILTGRFPWEHGLRDDTSPPLGDDVPTLATVLKSRGYRTGAFVASYRLGSPRGLARGFDVYDEPFGEIQVGMRRRRRPEQSAWEIVEKAIAWMKRDAAAPRPVFAWLHLNDPHAPYTPAEGFERRFEGRPYDAEIAYVDAQLTRLLGYLDEAGLAGRTLVVVTADHGEALGEHQEDTHRFLLYESTLRVPLLVRHPGVVPAGARLEGTVRSVDLLATVLDLAGTPALPTSGISRAPELRTGSRIAEVDSPAEAVFPQVRFGYAPLRALRRGQWKYIEAPRPELYHLARDPGETKNLVEAEPQRAAELLARLKAYRFPDPRLVRSFASDAPGADPKDRVQAYATFRRDVRDVHALERARAFSAALATLDRLARSAILDFEEQRLHGSLLLKAGRHAEAVEALETAVSMAPRQDQVAANLAEAYAALGRSADAAAAVERALKHLPRSHSLLMMRARQLSGAGDLTGARVLLERARDADHSDSRLRLQLGLLYKALDEPALALEEFQAATRLEPPMEESWLQYAEALAGAGRKKEAMAAYRVILKRDPRSRAALLGLARASLPEDPDAALDLLRRLMALDPGFPGTSDALAAARAAKAAQAPGG